MWLKWGAVAACLCAIFVISTLLPHLGIFTGSNGDDMGVSDTASTDVETFSDAVENDAPFSYEFDSFDEMSELRAVTKMSDADADKYLQDNDGIYSDFESKKEVSDLFKLFDSLDIFFISPESGYKLTYFRFTPEKSLIVYMYADSDGDRIRSINYLDQTASTEYDQAVYSELTFGETKVEFHTCHEENRDELYGFFTKGKNYYSIGFTNKDDYASVSQHLTLTTISELIDNIAAEKDDQ